MPSIGNCGDPVSGTYFDIRKKDLLVFVPITFTSWVRITKISAWFYSSEDAPNYWKGKYLLYEAEGDVETNSKVFESSLLSMELPFMQNFQISTDEKFILPPGTYRLAFWTKEVSFKFKLALVDSGTKFQMAKKTNIETPPEKLGSVSYEGDSSYWSFCIEYEELTVSEFKLEVEGPSNAKCDYLVENSGTTLAFSKLMPFTSSAPTGSTVTLSPCNYPEELDFKLIGPSSIAPTKTSYSIRWSQKVVYAAGRYWAFWSDTDDKMHYSSSVDGINWSPKVTLRDVNYKYGETCGVFFDGEFLHVHIKDATKIYLRIGKPNSDGSITWKADWQVIMDANSTGEGYAVTLTDHSYYYGPSSISYVSWHFALNYSGVSYLDAWWNHSTHDVTENGLWGENVIPEKFSDTDWRGSKILGLPDEKVLVLCVKAYWKMREFLYDGNWVSRLATNYEVVDQYPTGGENWSYDAVVLSLIHISEPTRPY